MMFDAVGAARFVIDVALRAAAAAAAVALLLRLLRIHAAATLHTAWTVVLFAMLLMPVLPSILPVLLVPVPTHAGFLLSVAPGVDPTAPVAMEYPRPAPDSSEVTVSARAGHPVRPADRLAAPLAEPPASRRSLPVAALAIYAAVVLLLVVRLLYGWSLALAMIRRARRGGPLRLDVRAQVYQSSEVVVPMTVGVIRPVVVLPVAWTTWDPDTLAAIVAHEAAHVRRRDASIAFAAHLNRAIFWFHPLAWWLERKLAMTAEHACDEAAARAIAAPARYAEILVEMADIVRRNRGRLAWQAVGVNGAGLLERRIDRLLRGEAFAAASFARNVTTAIGCIVLIAAVAACRQQVAATPLRADPELAKRIVHGDEQRKRFENARDMTQEQAEALERRIALNPEDFDAREQLVIYYRTSSKVAWDKKVPGLRRHALWLVEHHPEHEVQAPPLSPQFDPEGFAAAKKLWEGHLARPGASPFLVFRAASFFSPHDKPYAEQLIRRGMEMDPTSAALKARMPPDVGAYEWPMQLSSVYAAALLGSESVWGTYNDLRTHLDKVSSPYAQEVRTKLRATGDAQLLARVGSILVRPRTHSADPALTEIRALGVSYLERALELDPDLGVAKASLVTLRLPERTTDADRLANQAFGEYMQAEGAEYYSKDVALAKQHRGEAKTRAEEVLKIAAGHAQDPAYSAAVMTARQVLAAIALRDGDRELAVRHLRESVNVPASEQIQYAPPSTWLRPVNELLKEGERDEVVAFLEAFARLTIRERDRLLEDAKAIREGRMPFSYQRMVAREGQ